MSFADGGISSLKTLDGNPLACGGQPSYRHCYEYDPARMEWIDGPSLIDPRSSAPSAELRSSSLYWVASGANNGGRTSSEFFANGAFVEGPAIPEAVTTGWPCAAALSVDSAVLAGQYAIVFNFTAGTQDVIDQPMLFPSVQSMCGMATKSDGRRLFVVAGGNLGNAVDDRTQVYDFAAGKWRLAGELPFPLRMGATVTLGETFFIVGGRKGLTNTSSSDRLIQFDPDSETWVVRAERLKVERQSYAFAAFVNERDYECV